jgi:hypothetical protein
MTWADQHRRRAAVNAVLDYARRHPTAGLPYDTVPAAKQEFADRRQLLLALQHDWSQALWARIEQLSLAVRGPALTDAKGLARQAWRECAIANPVLRRLLDEGQALLGTATRREQDLLVAAGPGRHVA